MTDTLRERFAGASHITIGMLRPEVTEAEQLVAAGHWRKVHSYEDRDTGQLTEWDPATGIIEGYRVVPSRVSPDIMLEAGPDGLALLFGTQHWQTDVHYASLDPSRVRLAQVAERLGFALLAKHAVPLLPETFTEEEAVALIARLVAP